jgi:hypothetical protein
MTPKTRPVTWGSTVLGCYAADKLGCSIDTLARHYAGVIRELEGQARVPADNAIRASHQQVMQSHLRGERHV